MGRLKQTRTIHFLEKYGFRYSSRSGMQGEPGYTRIFPHANGSECLWVTVDFEHNKVYFYNELEFGGVLSQYTLDIPDNIADDEDAFIKWLEEEIPEDDG